MEAGALPKLPLANLRLRAVGTFLSDGLHAIGSFVAGSLRAVGTFLADGFWAVTTRLWPRTLSARWC